MTRDDPDEVEAAALAYMRQSAEQADEAIEWRRRAVTAETALERIAEQQPLTLAMIRHNGFVFDSIGREPGNWQHLAFTIYTDLCEVDSIARTVLTTRSE